MNLLKRIKEDERGSSLEVLIAVVMLLFIFFATIDPVIMMFKQQTLEQAKMKALDAMQIKGGLTLEIETAVRNYLTARGFNNSRITVTGTIAPIQWGNEVALEIRYSDTIKRFTRTSLITINRVTENVTYTATGSTTSYFFDNN